MGSIQILLGKTRVRRRAWNKYAQLTGTNVHGVPNFLYITDTRRKARAVESEFLRYRDGAVFVPAVTTLTGLLEELAVRHGDGRTCWSSGGTALVAERLLQEEAHLFPWLSALGDPERVGIAAASLASSWDEADRPPLEGRPELSAFLERLLTRLEADRARRPTASALRLLLHRLDHPTEALGQWLHRHHAVVIDDVLHPSPLRRRVLVALARAWRTAGVHVVLAFESGRDLGGAEAGRFFHYDDDHAVAFPLRPFQATRALRRALFEALVAEGGEADIVIVGADGTARVVEPWDEPGEPEPAGLADRLYADAPEPPGGTPRLPRIVRFADPATEVRTIAHAVKAHLLSGGRPEDTWVAFPGLPGYLPLVRRVFGALGIPFEVSSGRPVRARPVAEVLLMAARSAASGHPLGPMLAALASGLVGAVAERDALALARACRERGVTHARTDTWAAKLSDAAAHRAAIEAVDDARARLAPLADPVAPPRWRDTLMRVLEAWNIVERSGDTHDPATSVDSRMATGRALEALAQVADDALSVDAGAWEPLRLARLLEERLDAARLPDAKAGPRRIQVVGMLELRGIHPGWLWVGGLLADDFPARPTEDFLLSRTARRALDTLDPGDEARYIFASALRNAMAEGHTLTFSWPAARDDRPAAVSPVLEDLLEVHVEGQELRKRVEAGRAPTIPASPDELDALLGEARAARAESAPWAAHARDSARLARLAEVLDARRDRLGFSAWDGVLDRPPPLPDPLAVTRFEDYVACPARYFYRTLLDLYAERAWDPDLEARTAGVLLHGILDAFVRRVRAGGVDTLHGGSASDRAAWATLLHAVASERLDAARELGGLPGQLAAWHRRRWLAGLVDAAPRGLLAAWLDAEIASLLPTRFDRTEHTFRDHPVGPARLQGRVDRVDRVEGGGALVLDYKTGSAPKREHVEAGTKIQGFVYLDALAGGHGVAVYQELKSAATLRSAGWMGDPSVLSTLKVQPRSATVMSETDRATYAAYLADSASRLAAGRFHPTLAGPQRAGCDWCEFARCCRVDHARNSAIFAQGDERWQAPRRAAGDEEEDG